jgi:hypothetical protein
MSLIFKDMEKVDLEIKKIIAMMANGKRISDQDMEFTKL